MDDLIKFIKENSSDINKIKQLILNLLFNTICKKYPFANTIAILHMLHTNEFNNNFNIIDNINYDKLMEQIDKNENEILCGYLILLNEYENKKREIIKLINLFNKYKFNTKHNITIYTIKSYIVYILKPYFNANFDNKFIYSLYTPVNDVVWEDLHRNEIMTRLDNIVNLFNRNIIVLCDIKVKHISIINALSFNDLVEYFNLCGDNIRNKINYICDYLDKYFILNENINKLIEHNNNFIENDKNINDVICIDDIKI